MLVTAKTFDGSLTMWVSGPNHMKDKAVITDGRQPTEEEVRIAPFLGGVLSHIDAEEWDWEPWKKK